MEVKIIISGSRKYADWDSFLKHLHWFMEDQALSGRLTIISGGCSDKKNGVLTHTRPDGREVFGVDGMAERFAAEQNIPIEIYEADWDKHGNSAGPIRNTDMIVKGKATHCLAIPDKDSKGTRDMIKKAKAKKLITEIVEV